MLEIPEFLFYAATIAMIVVSLLLGIALFYLVQILRRVKRISEAAKEGSERFIRELRSGRSSFRALVSVIRSFF